MRRLCLSRSQLISVWNRRLAVLSTVIILMAFFAPKAAPESHHVFKRYKDRIVQIRIVNVQSGSKSSIGTGFLVSPSGHIITNYHVISSLVYHPEDYRAEFVRDDGRTGQVYLLNLDVVHDLAVVKADDLAGPFFQLQPIAVQKGERLYSIGNPYDLGFTIVEGTYNGLIEDSLYEKIHLTGSLNPGMSGGPTISAEGQVVGINVATAGNQVSFLVPVKYARSLLARTQKKKGPDDKSFLPYVRDQLLENQNHYMKQMMGAPIQTIALGSYNLPEKFVPYLKCWGDSPREERRPYEVVINTCSSQDSIFLNEKHWSGSIQFDHYRISSPQLNRFQYFNLYEDYFGRGANNLFGDEEDVTGFKCHTQFVHHNEITFKVSLCLRAYKKLPGLYDAVFKAATLNAQNDGVQTTLVLSGISFENAVRFSRKYLDSVSWKK